MGYRRPAGAGTGGQARGQVVTGEVLDDNPKVPRWPRDNHHVQSIIEAGNPISILSAGSAEAWPVRATIVGVSEECLRVEVGLPAPKSFPAVGIAVVGQGSRQRHARVNVTQSTPTDWSLRVAAPWSGPVDQRQQTRYPAHLAAVVRSGGHPGGLEARVLDLSCGGAAVQVREWDAAEGAFDLALDWSGAPIYQHCRPVAVERRWNGVVLHCAFVDMSVPQLAALEEITASLRSTFEEAQRYLAMRVNDP